jgi:O-antigen/teichoic acid export membrane protein
MKRILASLASVIGGEAAVRVANCAAALCIARVWGRETLGVYATCLAVVTVVTMFADNGLQTSAITQLSPAGAARNQIVGQLVLAKLVLMSAAIVSLGVVAATLNPGPRFFSIGAWVTLRTVVQSCSQLPIAVLKSTAKAHSVGMIQCIHSIFLLVTIWWCWRNGLSVFLLLGGMTLCQFLELALGMVAVRGSGLRASWPQRCEFWGTMKKSTPFGLTYGLAGLITRLDTIVLSGLVSLAELGTFSAANTVLLIVYVSSWLLGSVLLPEMVRLENDPQEVKAFADKWARLVAWVTVPCAVAAFWVAPKAVVLLYGRDFSGSAAAASMMALACPFVVLNSVYTTLAIALNRRAIFLGVFAGGAAAALLLDYVLGRALGARGIASAIVMREAGMLIGFLLLLSRVFSPAARRSTQVAARRVQEQFGEEV